MINTAVPLIQRLIQIESISKNEEALVAFFSDWLSKYFPKDSISIDDRNIAITITGKNFKEDSKESKTLLLCSHYDTVPVCSGWTKKPFGAEIENDSIYGLGANDALASVVSMTCGTLLSLNEILSSKNRVILSFVCEEELGNNGFVRIESTLPRYDYAIFGEPTSLRIGYCMRGSMKLKVLVRGKACHASRPHEGDNATFKLIDALQKIKSIELSDSSAWGTATLEPVRINSGIAENQIPDLVEIFLDSRPTWERNNEYIIEALKSTGLEFEVVRNIRRPMSIEKNHPLIQLLTSSLESPQFKTILYPFGGSCDMAFSKAPSVIFGPGASERSHAADEFIKIQELSEGIMAFSRIVSALS
jgi:acetylornithine deacetylase